MIVLYELWFGWVADILVWVLIFDFPVIVLGCLDLKVLYISVFDFCLLLGYLVCACLLLWVCCCFGWGFVWLWLVVCLLCCFGLELDFECFLIELVFLLVSFG